MAANVNLSVPNVGLIDDAGTHMVSFPATFSGLVLDPLSGVPDNLILIVPVGTIATKFPFLFFRVTSEPCPSPVSTSP